MKCSSELAVLNSTTLQVLSQDIGLGITLRVIEKCKLDFKRQLIETLNANRSKDCSALRLAVHSIAGIAAIFGAEKLRSIANDAEQSCIANDFAMASHHAVDVIMATHEFLWALERFDLKLLAHAHANSN
jgi:HPt (histidine-containing phosphotransfer) domain-containing protein